MGAYLFILGLGLTILVVHAVAGSWGLDVDSESEGGLFAWISISSLSFAATTGGFAGFMTAWGGMSPVLGAVVAVAAAAVGVAFHNSLFSWLRRTEGSSEVTNRDLVGASAVVVLGMSRKRRGQIVVEAAGQRLRLSAMADRAVRLPRGTPVRITRMDGGVAVVRRNDTTTRKEG